MPGAARSSRNARSRTAAPEEWRRRVARRRRGAAADIAHVAERPAHEVSEGPAAWFSTMLPAMWHTAALRSSKACRAAIVLALGASMASPEPKTTRSRPTPATPSPFPRRTTACPAPAPSAATTGSRTCGASAARPGRDRSSQDQHAVVFLGDSITQGWGGGLGAAFPGIKVANRGISGDTTRGVLLMLSRKTSSPSTRRRSCLLIGTNDLEEGASPEVIAGNLRLIVAGLEKHDPRMPIVLCQVFPSAATHEAPRGSDQGGERALSGRREERSAGPLPGDLAPVRRSERRRDPGRVPRPAAPERSRVRQVGGGPAPRVRDPRAVRDRRRSLPPEEGFESLFDGHDLTGWGYRPTTEADKESARRWQASDPNAAAWPFVTEPVAFDGLTATPDGRFAAHQRPARGHDPARVPQDPAALDDARVPRRLRPEARVSRHPERRQRRLPARSAAAVPRLPARRTLQGPEALQAAGLERARRDRPRRRGRGPPATASCSRPSSRCPATGPIGVEGDRGQMEYRRIRIKTLTR